jgi:hypothetical protein
MFSFLWIPEQSPVSANSFPLLTTVTRNSKSKSKLYFQPIVSQPVCLGIKHLSGAQDHIFISVRLFQVCWCGAPSMTRGGVCRFSAPAGHRQRTLNSKSKSKLCSDRRSVGQSFLVSSPHLGLTTRFLLLSDSCGFADVGRSLWRENGSAVYNCCWFSPAQSFLGSSPARLVTIF